MSTRFAALAFIATLTFAACNNGSPTSTPPPTLPATTPAGTAAPASQGTGTGDIDPNTVAGFCQLMTETIVANWPPRDSAAATTISPFLRTWASIDAFKAVSAELLAVADWTASMSIVDPVPAPPSDVAAAWDSIVAFQSSNCTA